MIKVIPTPEQIQKAKDQIAEFEKTEKGQYRYKGVHAWRGVVCEFVASDWLDENFTVDKKAKGIDTSGKYDDYDIVVNGHTIEIKSATCNYYRNIMPKKNLIDNKPKDLYIGVKYNEKAEPNECHILGFTFIEQIKACKVEQNKGAEYYKFPLNRLWDIEKIQHYI